MKSTDSLILRTYRGLEKVSILGTNFAFVRVDHARSVFR